MVWGMNEEAKNNKEDLAKEPQVELSSQGEQKQEAGEEQDSLLQIKESEYKKLLEEAAFYKDKYVRLLAEFENARKRFERDKIEFIKYANEGLIIEFLSILDNLERSVEAAKTKHEDYSAFQKGIKMVMNQIHDLLKKNGVKPIDAKGKKFDPHCHEILGQEERNDVEDGTVTEEFQKGYLLGERVVRTAKVKVAKGK